MTAAVRLWRGPALPDLRRFPDLEPALARVDATRQSALLALAELRLHHGATAEAAELSALALTLDEYDERAHRLAMAAELARRDFAAAARSAREALKTYRELRMVPCAATRILRQQCLTNRRTGNEPSLGPHLPARTPAGPAASGTLSA